MKKLLFILLLLPCLSFTLVKGKVIKVADGDTVTILTDDNEKVRVRFYGIDAPEKKQDYGHKARMFVNDLCYGKVVTVENRGTDRYSRILGVVYVDNININEALLKNGLAWHYKFYDKSAGYAILEKEARSKRINIWSLNNAIAPWEFRKKK